MSTALNILLVEDNPGDYLLVKEHLHLTPLQIGIIHAAGSLAEAVHVLESTAIDLVLLDLTLPDSYGIESFLSLNEYTSAIPVIILSGLENTETAMQTITMGAQDFLLKGEFNEKLLDKTIRYSIERKRNLEELRISNERYSLVSKATNDMVWDWDVVANKIYRSEEQFVKQLKYSADKKDFGPEFWVSLIHPDDKVVYHKILNDFENQEKNILDEEFRILDGEGNYWYVQDRGFIIRNEEGKVIRVIGATNDITERKIAEETLKQSEEKYRSLFNMMPASIFIWRISDYRILEMNDTAIRQYGYTRSEFLELTALDLRKPEDQQLFINYAKKVAATPGFSANGTWKHINKAKEEMYMQISSNRFDYNGEPAMMAIATDITDKIKLEEKLQEEKLKKDTEIKHAILAAQEKEQQQIGRELHDNVNQVLASTRLFIGLVKTNEGYISPHLDEADRLLQMAINEIRNLSHALIVPGMQGAELLKALDSLLKHTAGAAGLQVEKEINDFDAADLPEELKLAIYRIVQEQLNNIIKHAHAKTVLLTLKIQQGKVILGIKDDGQGFNPSTVSDGVGLLNVRNRASLFNGQMHICSAPGNGCELAVTFQLLGKEPLRQPFVNTVSN